MRKRFLKRHSIRQKRERVNFSLFNFIVHRYRYVFAIPFGRQVGIIKFLKTDPHSQWVGNLIANYLMALLKEHMYTFTHRYMYASGVQERGCGSARNGGGHTSVSSYQLNIFPNLLEARWKAGVELISNRVYLTFTHPRDLSYLATREEATIIKSGRGVTAPYQANFHSLAISTDVLTLSIIFFLLLLLKIFIRYNLS